MTIENVTPDFELFGRHRLISTHDPEKMRDLLFETYKARRFDTRSRSNGFFGQPNHVELDHVVLTFCAYGSDVEINFPEIGAVRQFICLAGSGQTIQDRREAPISLNETCVIAPEAQVATRYGAGYRQLVLRFNSDSLHKKLEALTGISAQSRLEFNVAASFETPALQALRRTILFLAAEIDSADMSMPHLALAELEQALMVSFLCAHRHNFSSLLERPALRAESWQIRLTEAYIEANWNKPLTVEAIAEAVGVSVRSIFKTFKDKRGYSPMAFAKTIRLKRA